MSLKLSARSRAAKPERPNILQRVQAIFGLAGLVLAWAVVLLPCAVWLLFSLLASKLPLPAARQQA